MSKQEKKKLTSPTIKLSDQKAGYTFAGKYCGTALGEPFKRINAKGEIEMKQLAFVIMEDAKGERVKYVADKGLQTALSEGLVKEGDRIEVVKLEKVSLKGERTMNQYDIFAL